MLFACLDDGKPKLPKQTTAAVAATKPVEISEAAAKKKEKALAEVSDADSSNPDSIPKLKVIFPSHISIIHYTLLIFYRSWILKK